MKKNKRKQFTLIELIIVIVVIGILAGMALPKFMGVQRDAKVAALQGDLDVLDKAIMLYNSNSEDNSYPISDKVEKDNLNKTLVDTLAKIDDDGTEIYNLDESKLSPYVSRLKYDINDYAYSTKTNHVFYKSGKIDSKGNIYYLTKSYLKSDGSESSKPNNGSGGSGEEVTPPADTTKPTVTLIPNTTDKTDKVVITVNASDESGIKSIELPNKNVITSVETTTYEVTSNGEYTFKVIDNNDNVTEKKITINNILTMSFKMYGDSKSDVLMSQSSTSDGGYIACGYTYGGGDFGTTKGESDALIIKFDSQGNKEWSKTYGGTGIDELKSIKQTSDGGYIAVGSNSGDGDFVSTRGNMLIVKFDSQGNKQWFKTMGRGNIIESYNSVVETSDGKFTVIGSMDNTSSTMFAKYDNEGNISKSSMLDGINGGKDIIYSMEKTSDGGYIAVGSNEVDGKTNALIMKFNNDGFDWSKTYSGSGNDKLYSIQQTSDGGYIACGYTYGGGDFGTTKGESDALIIKFDSQGNKEWSKTYGGSSSDELKSIQQTSDGGYIACGYTNGGGDFATSKGESDALIVKFDNNGNKIWSKTYGGSGNDELKSIQQTSDEAYVAVGSTNGGGDFANSNGETDTLFIKIK